MSLVFCLPTVLMMSKPFLFHDTSMTKLKKAPCIDGYSDHTMNPDVYILCKGPATVNVYRALYILSDAKLHFV
jgi:hypothetical protein